MELFRRDAVGGLKLIRRFIGRVDGRGWPGVDAVGAIIGGEGSGGVIYPDVHTGRDSLVAVALALSNLARSGMTLSQKRAAVPQYEIVKSKITLARQSDALPVIARIKAAMAPNATSINEEDGLRMEFGNTWLHVRASNTEPIMRIIAEAPTKAIERVSRRIRRISASG